MYWMTIAGQRHNDPHGVCCKVFLEDYYKLNNYFVSRGTGTWDHVTAIQVVCWLTNYYRSSAVATFIMM